MTLLDIFLILILASAIAASVVEDLRRLKIPNMITFPTMVMALAYHTLTSGLTGLLSSTGGLFLGIGLLIVPYMLNGMGAGDVKLMGAIGSVLGPKGILVTAVLVFLAGGIYGLIIYALNPKCSVSMLKRLWLTLKTFLYTAQFVPVTAADNEKLPVLRYSIPIALGVMAYVFMLVTNCDFFPKYLGNDYNFLSIHPF